MDIGDNKLVLKREPKANQFDLGTDFGNNIIKMIDSIIVDSIIKHSEVLAEHTIKNEIS